jgi:hypothetical protein
VTIVDWNAGLLVDREGDDIRTVLEFANVELLELRYLDRSLDDALDRSYQALTLPQSTSRLGLGGFGADRDHVARMQVDSAILFEGVNNALKLVGDQYLAGLSHGVATLSLGRVGRRHLTKTTDA